MTTTNVFGDTKMFMIGPHASRDKKGGFVETLEQLHRMGARCMQVFVGSTYGRLSEASEKRYFEEAPMVKATLKRLGMKLYVHAPYTLNFAKDPKDEDPYWVGWLWKLIQICEAMGVEGCVLHMGKAVKLEIAQAQQNFYTNLCQVLVHMKAAKCRAKMIIETSAGQGTELYPTIEQNLDPLVEFYHMFSASQRKYMGLCVDTCHIYAAGYNLSTRQQVREFWREFEQRIGIEHLSVIHMNNSVKDRTSQVDRHAPLEMGKIDFDALTLFAQMAHDRQIPMIVETSEPVRDVVVLRKMLEGTYSKASVDREIRDQMFA